MLKPLIMAAMEQFPLGLSEFDLICEIKKSSHVFPENYHGDNLKLFRTHFLLFNSLYRLRREIVDKGNQTLEIGPLNICIRAFGADSDTRSLADPVDMKLEEYYLDIDHLEKTGMEDVDGMLDEFWQKYLAQSHKAEALLGLGLDEDADWPDVQKRYRELAGLHHPDKGGSKERFQKLTAAKETLKVCFGK